MIYILVKLFKNKIWTLPVAYLLVVILFILARIPSGAIGNILTAPWYHDENRIVTLAPIVMIPLLAVFFVNYKFDKMLLGKIDAFVQKLFKRRTLSKKFILCLPLVALILVYMFVDPTRGYLSNDTNEVADIDSATGYGILTPDKLSAFGEMDKYISKNDIVFGDPFTGLQYYYIYNGRNVYYPYVNPRLDRSKEEKDVLLNFGEPSSMLNPEKIGFVNPNQMLKTLCAVNGEKKFFVDFGLPYRYNMDVQKQFGGFRDRYSIQKYVNANALKELIRIPTSQGVYFIIYELACK
jgi:hypothetical protein